VKKFLGGKKRRRKKKLWISARIPETAAYETDQ
jgi:hypothetical protein